VFINESYLEGGAPYKEVIASFVLDPLERGNESDHKRFIDYMAFRTLNIGKIFLGLIG
jgi:hypothetical protein